jgi:hypothetical protein
MPSAGVVTFQIYRAYTPITNAKTDCVLHHTSVPCIRDTGCTHKETKAIVSTFVRTPNQGILHPPLYVIPCVHFCLIGPLEMQL